MLHKHSSDIQFIMPIFNFPDNKILYTITNTLNKNTTTFIIYFAKPH